MSIQSTFIKALRINMLVLIVLSSFFYSSMLGQSNLGQPVAQNEMQNKKFNYSTFTSEQKQVITEELRSLTPAEYKTHPDYGKTPFNTQCTDCIELIEKRTANTRYFVKSGTKSKVFYLQQGYGEINYKVNDKFIAIDSRLKPDPSQNGIYHAPNQPMPTLLNASTGVTKIKLSQFELSFNANPKIYHLEAGNETLIYGNINMSSTSVGEDGALTTNAFPGINRTVAFDRGSVKTNFILSYAPTLPSADGWLAFEDMIDLPNGYKIVKDIAGSVTPEGYWQGELKLINETTGEEAARWGAVIVNDNGPNRPIASNAAYQIKNIGNTYFIRTLVKVSWLNESSRAYPVTIDPLVSGTATWSAGLIGFSPYVAGNGFCGNSSQWCLGGPLNVNFPGGAQVTNVIWSMTFEAIFPAWKSDGGFRMVGPCAEDPVSPNGWWSCASPLGDAPGQCIGTNIVVPGLATCNVPSCLPTIIPFRVKNIYCTFPLAGLCTTTRLRTMNNTWIVTVEGRTVEWTNVANPFSLASNSVCAGGNITATSNGIQYGVPAYSLNWSFSATGIPSVGTGNTPSINFPTAGVVTVYGIVTDACGNTATVSKTVNVVPIPTANAGTPQNLTCVQTTTVLSGSGGGTYSWTGPGTITTPTSQNPTVNTPGVFSLIVNVAGCNSPAANVTVTQNTTAPLPTAGTSASVTCTNSVINLTSNPAGLTYTWTAPGGSSITGGVNNQNTTGSGLGTYTVRVTDAVNGCTNIATVAALINTTTPVPTAGTSASVTCTNSVINLTSNPAGLTYTWTAPGGSSITGGVNIQNTTGSGPGTYTVRVQDAVNGCTAIATVAALINTTTPVPTAGTSASVTCTNSVINLTSNPAGLSYTWTAPGGSSITGGINNQNTTGSGPGTYTVKVQDAVNGCTAIATVAAVINTTAPTPTAGIAGLVTCGSATVSLTSGPSAMNYTWTAPGGSSITGGVNNQNTTGLGGGTYSVIVQSPINGCSTQSVVTATTNTALPVPSINPPSTITCTNPTITLTGNPGAGVTYTWSGPGIVGSANNSTVNVNAVGTYSLFVTSTVNSCTNVVNVAVANNIIPPTITPVATQTITCATPSVNLIGSANPSTCTVVWTGGVCAGATSYTATACAAGSYTYIATNPANGCASAPQVASVVPNAGVPSVTLSNTGTITCIATSVQVISTTTTSPATYVWSGPGIVSGAGTGTINVNLSGVYSLTLTNTLNGCTSVITNSITADNAAVTPTTTSSTIITCTNPTSTLTTSVAAGTYSYNWSGPGIVGTNTLSTATSSLGGTYTVTVTNTTNGCVGIGTISVASSTTVPASVTVTPSSFTLSCATPTTQIIVGSTGGTTYSWTAPGTGNILSGATTATASISGPGVYSVVVTGTNGCSAAVTTATMVADVNSPNVTLSSPNLSITCTSATPGLTLTPTGTVVIASYSWSPASGISSGSNTTTPTFTAAGTYTCLITAANGCTITATIPVTNNTVVPSAITPTIANISCASTSVDINPTYNPTSGITFTWTGTGIVGSANNPSVTVNQSGNYTVTMVDPVNGCTNTAVMTVNGNTVVPTVTVTSTSSIGIGCSPTNSTITLDATSTPSSGVTYSWSTSASTQTISTTTAGVYTVIVTDGVNGCSVATQYSVTNNSTLPNVTAGTNASIPCGGVTTTVTLNGNSTDPGVIYAWAGPGIVSGSNTATPVVNVAGTYTLSVTNPTTGCVATSTVDVINAVPTASIIPDITTGFAPLTVNLTNASSNASIFSWNFGNGSTSTSTNTSATYNSGGIYTITLIASSGLCSDTAMVVIIVDDAFSIEVPNVFTPNDDNINDFFTITSKGVKEITLKIFNRWGQLMYDFNGAKASWDGISNNGQKATQGTYFYFIKAVGFDGKEYEKNGPVSLFR